MSVATTRGETKLERLGSKKRNRREGQCCCCGLGSGGGGGDCGIIVRYAVLAKQRIYVRKKITKMWKTKTSRVPLRDRLRTSVCTRRLRTRIRPCTL